MSTSNSKQNIVTALAIIVALAAVAYAFIVQSRVSGVAGGSDVVSEAGKEDAYTKGDENPVVLKIDGRDVTRAEVMDNFAESGSQIPAGAAMEQIFPLLQEQYLVGYLLNTAAQTSGINGTNPEVAKRIEDAREQAIRAVYLEDLTKNAVTESDIRKAYDDIVMNSPAIKERHARHILVKTAEEAKKLIEDLKNGADFEVLARDHSTGPSASNGGDLGYFTEGDMVPEFSKAAFSMKVGDVSSEPVQTQFGYHIIKIEDERERAKPTFDEMKGQIEQQLRQGVIREKIMELRNKADVEVMDFNGKPMPLTAEEQAAAEKADAPAAEDATTAAEPATTEEAPAAAMDTEATAEEAPAKTEE